MGKISKLAIRIFLKIQNPRWEKIEYFDELWKNRIAKMAGYINQGDVKVCDIGCGKEWLRDFLPQGVEYYPADYTKRSDQTIVCDLNKKELPRTEIISGVIFCSGVMEYVIDYSWFITEITRYSSKVILSYCTLDESPDIRNRKKLAWKNHLRTDEIISMFIDHDFFLDEKSDYNKNTIFVFKKNKSTL